MGKCKTPKILEFCIEGSTEVLVGADLLLDGVEVTLHDSTGQIGDGIINGGLALILLGDPLVYATEIWCEINTASCVSKSCSAFVGRISTDCVIDASDNPSGELTGRLICSEKDFYREVYDGDGGVIAKGVLAQEDCIYCGGNLPNCEEPPIEPTTFYNIVSCVDGNVYQTTTVLTVANQRVSHPIHGLHRWNGTTQTTAPNFRGEVSILVGETGCPATTLYYNIVRCSDGTVKQTTTVRNIVNQSLAKAGDSYPAGGYVWNGTTTTTPTENIGTVTILTGEFGCN